MPEIELKYDLTPALMERIGNSLAGTARFGVFSARQTGTVDHEDTYFDRHNRLYERGWSLRVREAGSTFRITCKRPVSRTALSGDALEREELESTSEGDVREVFEDVVRLLRGNDLLAAGDGSVPHPLSVGLFEAFRQVGLQRLFTIKTRRSRWILVRDGADVAELALDESSYGTSDSERLVTLQMEIEALGAAECISALDTVARQEFGLHPTRVTKFQRGVEYHGATQAAEKIEAKLELPSAADYRTLTELFVSDPTFLSGYCFTGTEGVPRDIVDHYFDTESLELAKKNAYLRLREENGRQKLQLRRMANPTRWDSLLPVQEEIKADDAAEGYQRNWPIMLQLLQRILDRNLPAVPAVDGIEERLGKLELRQVLSATVQRRAWIVEQVEKPSKRTAKIKYDLVTFGGGVKHPESVKHLELEVTGLEDEEQAPTYIDSQTFLAFVHSLGHFCEGRFPSDNNLHGRPHLGSKYVTGLVKTGQLDEGVIPTELLPPVAGVVRLEVIHVPAARERRSVLRLALFILISMAGLFLLGWVDGADPSPLRLGGGFALLSLASVLLITDRVQLVGALVRRLLVLAVGVAAAAVLLVRLGLGVSADLMSVIAWPLTVIGLLAFNIRKRNAAGGDG